MSAWATRRRGRHLHRCCAKDTRSRAAPVGGLVRLIAAPTRRAWSDRRRARRVGWWNVTVLSKRGLNRCKFLRGGAHGLDCLRPTMGKIAEGGVPRAGRYEVINPRRTRDGDDQANARGAAASAAPHRAIWPVPALLRGSASNATSSG